MQFLDNIQQKVVRVEMYVYGGEAERLLELEELQDQLYDRMFRERDMGVYKLMQEEMAELENDIRALMRCLAHDVARAYENHKKYGA